MCPSQMTQLLTLSFRRWMRSADVRILRQLVSVHEGIEAMRWLMLDRRALASRDSSLTGSASSLVMAEEPGPSASSCRDVPSSTDAEKLPGSLKAEGWKSRSSFSDSQLQHSEVCTKADGGLVQSTTRTTGDTKADEKSREEVKNMANEILFGYDAQWCWIESQDDVTFL
uniref:leucine rich adaptor protein 1-like isoform X2 n=1 Tax=Doryrhamphus excisus TaxID=161450 RepID=UPI0025AEB4E5|nr:leucine rich adaptor protein 1-like isoform X2 [Doryrhamphus excisus]XP_057923559.1 leucine rich adaptor protein 1-like isoform X2 [Doryrhamphus excisus]